MRYHFTAHQEINCGLNEQSRQDSRKLDGTHHLVRPHASVRSSVHSRTLSVVNFVLALGLSRPPLRRPRQQSRRRPRARPPAMHLPIAHEFLPPNGDRRLGRFGRPWIRHRADHPTTSAGAGSPTEAAAAAESGSSTWSDSHRGRHIRVFTDVEIIRSFPLHGKICFHSQVAISPRYGRSINDGFPRSGRSKASTKSRRRGVVCHASPKSD